jgi:hypothetical protein
MSFLRAIVVTLTALSAALLPVAGAHSFAFVPQTFHLAVTSDCCPQGQHCDHQTKGDCGEAGCAFNCFVPAAPLGDSGAAFGLSDLDKAMRMAGFAKPQSPNPPSPPPRA